MHQVEQAEHLSDSLQIPVLVQQNWDKISREIDFQDALLKW